MQYLYADIRSLMFRSFKQRDMAFMNILYRGLRPRIFRQDNPDDTIVVEEDAFVDEMIFIASGTVGVGFSRFGNYSKKDGPYVFCVRQAAG